MSESSSALIYGNGMPLPEELFRDLQREHRLLIAADGGAYHVIAHGELPDLIIGDMDSFTDPPPRGVSVIRDPDQETNDLQKALNWAAAKQISHVTIAGAAGDRLDHNLNNLSVMLEFSRRFSRLQLVDSFGTHVVVHTKLTITTSPGRTVSLYPLSGPVARVTTEGLRYPLTQEPLAPGVRTGCLNEATAGHCRITVEDGALLVSVAHGDR